MKSKSDLQAGLMDSTDRLGHLILQMILLYLYTIFTTCRFTVPFVFNIAFEGIFFTGISVVRELRWLRSSPALISRFLFISPLLFHILLALTWLILIS